MKYLLIPLALALSSAAFSSQAATPTSSASMQAAVVKSLAARPMGVVVGDKCEIRGAVWGAGPRPDVRMALIDIQTMNVYGATTAPNGVYSLSIPYHGKPVILQERIADQIYALASVAKDVRVIDGAVVCDHRLQQKFPSTQSKDA